MPAIVSVETNGSLKEMSIKGGELFKKAGFKVATGFELRTTWNLVCEGKSYEIELYGKIDGRAGQENKYEMPPPVDNLLIFGRCLLVNKLGDLNVAQWKQVYNQLYGGFEDLDEDDGEEDEEDNDLPLTKAGYAKDGFVVDDAEEEEEDEDYIPTEGTYGSLPLTAARSYAPSAQNPPFPKQRAATKRQPTSTKKAVSKPRTKVNKAAAPAPVATTPKETEPELEEEAYL